LVPVYYCPAHLAKQVKAECVSGNPGEVKTEPDITPDTHLVNVTVTLKYMLGVPGL
jgi:hypothetical protein